MAHAGEPPVPRHAEVLDEGAWQDRLDSLAGHSFFATPAWGRVLSGAGIGFHSRALEFDVGGARALLPLVWRTDRLGLFVYRSGAFGTYGGLIPLGEAPASASGPGSEVAGSLRRTPRFGLLIATPGPRPHLALPSQFDSYVAHVIDVAGRSAEQVVAAMRTKTRQYVRKAERDSVRIALGGSGEDFRAYYGLLEASARRWGRSDPGKPWAIFEAIQRECGDGTARLWMAWVGAEPAAGLLCFYGKGEVFAWSAALDERFAGTRANYALHARAISDAADRGFQVFNLGANVGLEGVTWFKEGLGATPRVYPAYVVAGRLYGAALGAWRAYRSVTAARQTASA